jgi:hypothetical protein
MKNDTVSLHKGKEKVDQQVAIVTGSSSSRIGYETSLPVSAVGIKDDEP